MIAKCPKVSIIIPMYNAEEFIGSCLKSVLSQDYYNLEVIVIDDGSTDLSLEALESFKNRVIIFSQENSGAPVARNRGLLIASGKYVKFLDSDDVLEEGVIKRQVEKLESLKENDIVYGDYYLDNGSYLKLIKTKLRHKSLAASLILQDILIATPLYRKLQLNSVGGFDESLKSGQEWELHIRLAVAGCNFNYMSIPIFRYRVGHSENTISKKTYKTTYNRRQYDIEKTDLLCEKIKFKMDSDVASAISHRYWWIGRSCLRHGFDDLAKVSFCKSKEISSNYKEYWPFVYKFFCGFFGVRYTEKIFSFRYR